MKKIIGGILLLCVCVVIVVVLARNFIVKTAVIKGINALAGLKVEIEKIDIGLLKPTVEIDSIKLYNPAGFSDKLMANIPKVYVKYDLGGFLKNRVHLNELKIEITQLYAVLNEQGNLNFNSLALLMPKPSGAKPPEVSIDQLSLKIGQVAYKGYFPLVGTKTMEFNPNIDETFNNVTNPSQVAGDVLKKILSQIGISDFAKFDIAGEVATLKEELNQTLNATVESVKSSAQEVESSAQETLNKTKEDFKNIFSQ